MPEARGTAMSAAKARALEAGHDADRPGCWMIEESAVPRRALLVVLVTGALAFAGLPETAAAAAPAPTVLRTMSALAPLDADTSRAAEAPVPFTMVGFTAPAGAELRVRVSADGERWTDWAHVELLPPDEGPDPGSHEPAIPAGGLVPTEPVWTGAARWLQVDVEGAEPDEVVPTVIDTLGQTRSLPGRMWDAVRAAWRPAAAEAITTAPAIVSRAGWGADESLRSGSPSYSRRIRAGFVHHTVNANTYTQAEAAGLVRGIYRYHTQSLGWDDIGYNFLVDRFGTVYEGRAGGADRPVIGAHAGGFNTSTFGVSSLGTHTTAGPGAEALESIARMIAWKFDLHHVDVAGAAVLTSRGSTRFAEGQQVRLATVSGHRAVSETSCPGQALENLLPAIRHRVLQLGGDMILDHEASPLRLRVARGRAVDGGVRFSARLRPAGQWDLELRDPAGAVVHEASGEGEAVSSSWTPPPASPLGRYQWRVTSPGRRTAEEHVDLVPPVIENARAGSGVARGGKDAGFEQPVGFTATLWAGAVWTLTVTDPSGALVHQAAGTGPQLASSWAGRPGLAPGRYAWRMEADDAPPVTGSFEVLWPVLARTAVEPDAVAESTAMSRATFAAGQARHVVLARADLFADAMAGGPLAGREGPVLLTGKDRLDPRVDAELERVLPRGGRVYVLGGEGAVAPAVADAMRTRWQVIRLAGPGRVETAVSVADWILRERPQPRILVARAGPDSAVPWADALAGGAYGAWAGVPVLLTDSGQLPLRVEEFLRRHAVRESIVLGGPAAISDAVAARLPGARRVYGADRAGTAAAVAEQLWGRSAGRDGDRVVVANGYTAGAWTLPLTAAPLAARSDAPLLLVTRDTVPPSTLAHLDRLAYGATRTAGGWLLGGEDRVGQAAMDEVLRRLQ